MAGHRGRALEKQGALSNPRIAPHQNKGPRHKTSAENPIEFTGAGFQPLEGLVIQGGHRR